MKQQNIELNEKIWKLWNKIQNIITKNFTSIYILSFMIQYFDWNYVIKLTLLTDMMIWWNTVTDWLAPSDHVTLA